MKLKLTQQLFSKKNENHYNATNPGKWLINYSDSPAMTSTVNLYTFTDDNLPPLTIYSTVVSFASAKPSDHGVLQVIYAPGNNVPTFYQCSDITLRN